MTQEEINDLLNKNASPEAEIAFRQRMYDAIERNCICQFSPSYWDTDCHYDGHRYLTAIPDSPKLDTTKQETYRIQGHEHLRTRQTDCTLR